MQIAITGHTKGIGKAISNRFNKHHVKGFSITDGYDIGDPQTRKEIIEKIRECEVFVNNAFDKTGQTELLKEMISCWHNTNKLIVHMNSKAIFFNDESLYQQKLQQGLLFKEYIEAKREQQSIIDKHILKSSPNILNVILGPVESGFGNLLHCEKLTVSDVADYIHFCISNKDRIHTQQVVIDVPNQSWSEISIK